MGQRDGSPSVKPLRAITPPAEPYRPSTGDPAQIFVDLAVRLEKAAERVEALLTEAQPAGAREAAAAIMAEVPHAMRIEAARVHRLFIVLTVCVALAFAVVVVGVALLWLQPGCHVQDGGYVCYAWLQLPKGR